MSMLNRFRKPGGFQQLLALIETCEPVKQKDLLHLVGNEDPGWAHLVKSKALNFERVLSWPVEVLMEITPHLPDKILAIAYLMAESRSTQGNLYHEKWIKSLPTMKAREVHSLSAGLEINASEQNTAVIKIIQIVRELESKGQIRFAQFDPSLEVDKRLAA